MLKKRLLALYWLIIVLAMIGKVLFSYYNPFLFDSRIHEISVTVSIEKGENAKSIAKSLHEKKIIPSQFWFLSYLFLKGWSKELKYGKYEFFSGNTPIDVIEKIHQGDVVDYRLTIIEGWKFSDIREKLAQLENIEHSIEKLSNKAVAQRLEINDKFLDGAFLPNTYHYPEGELDINILKRARDAMRVVYERELKNYQKNPLRHSSFLSLTTSLQDEYKVLSLAAIIEKETFVVSEYPIISSVFHNRLLRGMRLQADPTVIYAIGDEYKGRILSKHLRFKSPYNTYAIRGLPPYPIAYASEKAIYAAFNPSLSKYLYFVAKGNGREHIFNTSLEEHSKAVDRYWKIIKKRKKKK